MPVNNSDDVAQTQWAENGRFFSDGRFKQLTLFVGGLTIAGAGIAQYRDDVIMPGITMASCWRKPQCSLPQ